MRLKSIIKLEEKLLKINENYKTTLNFEEVLYLKRYMKEIAEITDTYFELMDSKAFTTMDDATTYNDTLQQSNVSDDFINFEDIKKFCKEIIKKYSLNL